MQEFRSDGTAAPRRREDDRLYEKLSLIIDSLDSLYKLDKRDFLRKVFESAFELIPEAQKGSLYELDGERYRPIFCRGYDFEVLSRISFSRDEAFIDFAVDENASITAYETRISGRDPAKFPPETMAAFAELGTLAGFTSLYAPINVEGITVGLISLEKFDEGNFPGLSRKVLQYYARLISQFYSQKLYQERQTRLYQDIVTSLVSAIEVMDRYTEGHAKRVAEYSRAIGARLGLTEAELSDIGTAALLHDIGKIGIPTEILRKPDKLDSAEYEIVKRHPAHAAKILSVIGGFERIVELAYRHHERYDGKGYPEGIVGDDIPFGALIIGLADAVDAMTSARSYRPAMSLEQAIEIVRAGSGSQFHPAVVRAALDVFAERSGAV
jgi:polar amino acid transport system substrate-binding protein